VALNFPSSPSVGDTYTDTTSGFSYEWDGTVWKSYASASASNIRVLDDISGSFNGSTQTFALTVSGVALTPASAQQLRIVLGGVVQSPGTDYTVSSSNITFTTPPDSILSFSGVSLGPAVPVTYANDGNIYVRNTYTGAGTTGPFAFAQGYTIGYLDVYRNGVRLSSGTDFVGTSGTNFFLTDAAAVNDELEAIGYTVTAFVSASSNLSNLNVTGIGTITTLDVNGAADLTQLNVSGVSTVGVVTGGTYYGDGSNLTGTGAALSAASGDQRLVVTSLTSGAMTSAATDADLSWNSTTNTLSAANISIAGTITYNDVTNVDSVGIITAQSGIQVISNGIVVNSGITTLTTLIPTESRFITVSEKLTRIDGNTVNLTYNSSSANIGFATNPSGDITLNVTNIPETSDFDNHVLTFSVFVNQTGTARTCTAITLNGVSKTINWAGGSLSAAIAGVTTSSGTDIYTFTGINTVGSASTADNYRVLGMVNGGFA